MLNLYNINVNFMLKNYVCKLMIQLKDIHDQPIIIKVNNINKRKKQKREIKSRT